MTKQIELRDRHFYEFGPYKLDTDERVLLRGDDFISLTPKAFDTLLVLVESSGRILEKDELLRRVWPDTFVEEVNLAKKISLLRKVLGEDQTQQYIETIPRRGYRFSARVEEVCQPAGSPPPLPLVNVQYKDKPGLGQTKSGQNQGTRKWVITILMGVVLLCILITLYVTNNIYIDRSNFVASRTIPLTSYPGRESQPAFSPDGNYIAFVWNGGGIDNDDIYVKTVGSENPLRLTNNEAADTTPAWSPDGKYISFLRTSDEGRVYYMIPALGGSEIKLAEVYDDRVVNRGNSPYFSPDGNYIAVPDKLAADNSTSIYLLPTDRGAGKLKLTHPPTGITGDHYPAFSPDGRMIAFIRSLSIGSDDIYIMPVKGGETRRLTHDNVTIIGLTWSQDSKHIVFSSRRGGGAHSLWKVSINGATPIIIETKTTPAWTPTIAYKGDRLAYSNYLDDMNIMRIQLNEPESKKFSYDFIASTFMDNSPDYSPDGKKILFMSGRSGGHGIWICNNDGSSLRLLIDNGPFVAGSPRWSPDGRWIAFDARTSLKSSPESQGNPDIFIIAVDGARARKITQHHAEDIAPGWSRDGKWIYHASNRSGSMQIWKTSVLDGTGFQITFNGGYEAFESFDNKFVYFTKPGNSAGIWKIPTSGGKEELVIDQYQAGKSRYWRVVNDGIYFAANSKGSHTIEFYNFSTRKTSSITQTTKIPSLNLPGLAISPDNRTILFSHTQSKAGDISLIENFRP